MEEQIQDFGAQFVWEPNIEHGDKLPHDLPAIVCGMGGSHLGARLLATDPLCPSLFIHSDYGIPNLPDTDKSGSLYIASSYSGDTEETLDAAATAHEAGYAVAAMASGGKLAEFARAHNIPFILLPSVAIEPRMAIGYQMLALARLLRNVPLEASVRKAGNALSLIDARTAGELLAKTLEGRVPVFYCSTRNGALGYHLKANINESAKIPAFYNVVPELCHNELAGYENPNEALMSVFLEDDADNEHAKKRMMLIRTMLHERNHQTTSLALVGSSALHKALQTVLIGSFAGARIARSLGVEDAKTPLIAEFKRRLLAL